MHRVDRRAAQLQPSHLRNAGDERQAGGDEDAAGHPIEAGKQQGENRSAASHLPTWTMGCTRDPSASVIMSRGTSWEMVMLGSCAAEALKHWRTSVRHRVCAGGRRVRGRANGRSGGDCEHDPTRVKVGE